MQLLNDENSRAIMLLRMPLAASPVESTALLCAGDPFGSLVHKCFCQPFTAGITQYFEPRIRDLSRAGDTKEE